MKSTQRISGVIGLSLLLSSLHAAPLQLPFWHSMAGSLGQTVETMTDDFNKNHPEYEIVPVYKGSYVETLSAFAAAFRAGKAPALVQIFEVGKTLMSSPEGAIVPIDNLVTLPKADFFPAVRDYYSDKGKLLAFPFNISIPVLYYNKARIGKEKLPKTWMDLEKLALKLKKQGADCVYTSSYPGWILIESYLSNLGHPLVYQGRSAFESGVLQAPLQRLKRWQEAEIFRYAGREDEATILFTSGLCPFLSQSSGAYASLEDLSDFSVGILPMPEDKRTAGNVPGGAALWVTSGQSKEAYAGLAAFIAFLAEPKTQALWHKETGYLPLGLEGQYHSLIQPENQAILDIAKEALNQAPILPDKAPLHALRLLNNTLLEAYFADLISADTFLKEGQEKTTAILERFKHTH